MRSLLDHGHLGVPLVDSYDRLTVVRFLSTWVDKKLVSGYLEKMVGSEKKIGGH